MDLDQEFATRNFIFPVDESQHQTDLIQRENFTETERIINKITGKVEYDYKYQQLKKALTLLELYTVLIPYENALIRIFPTTEVRTRRDSKKLITLIKESALLFQYQRPKGTLNGQPVLIATWQDLQHALEYGGKILEATLTGMDTRLITALPIVMQMAKSKDEGGEGYITVKKLQAKMGDSESYCRDIIRFFNNHHPLPAHSRQYT